MMISAGLAAAAVAVPLLVVPARRAAGLPTYQWDGTSENPVRWPRRRAAADGRAGGGGAPFRGRSLMRRAPRGRAARSPPSV